MYNKGRINIFEFEFELSLSLNKECPQELREIAYISVVRSIPE